jgi:hypothetical protein
MITLQAKTENDIIDYLNQEFPEPVLIYWHHTDGKPPMEVRLDGLGAFRNDRHYDDAKKSLESLAKNLNPIKSKPVKRWKHISTDSTTPEKKKPVYQGDTLKHYFNHQSMTGFYCLNTPGNQTFARYSLYNYGQTYEIKHHGFNTGVCKGGIAEVRDYVSNLFAKRFGKLPNIETVS